MMRLFVFYLYSYQPLKTKKKLLRFRCREIQGNSAPVACSDIYTLRQSMQNLDLNNALTNQKYLWESLATYWEWYCKPPKTEIQRSFTKRLPIVNCRETTLAECFMQVTLQGRFHRIITNWGVVQI